MTDEERLEVRRSTINELSSFIDSSQKQLEELLNRLQWTQEEIFTETEKKMKVCPINPDHLVPEASLEEHTHQCELVRRGYSREEQKNLPSSHSFFYEKAPSVVPVMIDKESQREILSRVPGLSGRSLDKDVPLTVDAMDKAFTSAEKLAIHLAVLEKAKMSKRQQAVSLQELEYDPDALLKKDNANKPKSRLEILAEIRDYKRRRQSYRAKNVHITRRTQTEVMREIIEAQMSEIKQAIEGIDRSEEGSEHRGGSPSPSQSRSRDVSRSPSRFRSRRDDDGRNDYSRDDREHRERRPSKRSRREDDYPARRGSHRSRDELSRSPGSSTSRRDDNRSRDRNSKDEEVSQSPRIKVEAMETSQSRESSPGHLRKNQSRELLGTPSVPGDGEAIRVKVEEESEPGSRSPSQGRGEDREQGGSRRHHHHQHRSKHKHRHKHRHHSRDSR